MAGSMPRSRIALIVVLFTAITGAAATWEPAGGGGRGWGMIGHDPTNSRNQPFEHRIGPRTSATSP